MVKRREDTDIKKQMYQRVKIVYGLFILVGLCVMLRLLWVLFFSAEISHNATRLDERIFFSDTIYARRGSIVARGGEPLATSILRYRIDFDMGSEGFDSLELFTEHVDSLSKLLSGFFGDRKASEYRRMMLDERKKHYRLVNARDTMVRRSEGLLGKMWDLLTGDEFRNMRIFDTVRSHEPVHILPREVDYTEWQTLRTYPILNWNLGMTYKAQTLDQRVYPYGELGRRTLGMVTMNLSEEDRKSNRGHYGIEHIYREQLEGQGGKTLRQRIAPGYSAAIHSDSNVMAVDGMDIITTLDVEIQQAADAALRRQLAVQNAIWGTTMVMDVHTGDLLAVVNLGETGDKSGVYYEKDNYAFNRRIEPGSTFKLVSLLALIDDCKHPITKQYNAHEGRRVQVGGSRGPYVQDDHNIGAMIDMKSATAQSSNVYFADAIYQNYKDNPQRYLDLLKRLHLYEDVGFADMGERTPYIPDYKNKNQWNAHSLPNMGYGYTVELPPVRMLTLYNAIAAGGRMVAPRLVRGIRRGDEMVEEFEVRVLAEQICSPESRAAIHECLVETARTGTTKEYFRDTLLFRVASKTGTAKVAQDGNGNGAPYGNYYMGTVAAYFPADNPKYTILTSILTDRRRGKNYYGGGLAGPVVKEVVNYIYYRDEEWHQTLASSSVEHHPSRLKGGNVEQVRSVADKFSPRTSYESRKGWGVVKTDSLHNVDIRNVEGQDVMPDVIGMGLKDALYMLESRGLKVRFSGKGTVGSQSIPAGRKIRRGQDVSLILK